MKKILALMIVVLLVLAGWTGAWFWGAGEIRAQIAALGTADGETATRVTCGTTNVTGFPFRFDIECADATVVDQDVTVTVAGVRASVLAYHPTQVVFSTLGPVTVSDAFSGGSWRIDYAANHGSARLHTDDLLKSLGGDGWRIGRISIVADGIDVLDTVVSDTRVLSAKHAEIQIIDMPELHDIAKGTAALAGYATLEEATAPAYGLDGAQASAEVELTGLPDDIRTYGAADLLARWESQQGKLKLVNLRGTNGEDYVESSGELRLANGARLDGTLTLKSKGLVERLGTSVPADLKALMLGTPAADGSYGQALNIKAGVVFVGLVPVAMIPPLN